MIIQGKIQKRSLAFYILEHLFNVGSIRRKDIALLFSSMRNAEVIRRKIRQLELEGLIEVSESKNYEIRRVKLTSKGLEEFCQASDYYKKYKNFRVRPKKTPEEKEAKEMEVMTLMAASSVRCYPREKPELIELVNILSKMKVNQENKSERYWYPKDLNDFADRFGDGIYYSPSEVREALREDIGAEQIYRSRFNGVLVLPDRIYVIYHVRDGLMKFNNPTEETLLDTLMTLFGGYAAYASPNTPSAIAVGNASLEIGISSLVTGFKKGKIEHKESLDNVAAQEAMSFLKANCSLFPEIFYIPMEREGIYYLNELMTTTTETRAKEAKEWFLHRKGYIYMDGLMETGICVQDNCKTEYILYPETKKILMLRNSLYPARVITSNMLAEAISKSVGPKVLDFVDLANLPMRVQRYDIYGYQIEGEKTKKYKGGKYVTNINVNARVDLSLYDIIEKDANKKNQSMSKTIQEILRDYYIKQYNEE